MKNNARVLVIGSGGREHAFAWSLERDENVKKVFCIPGNGGTETIATNVDIDINNFDSIIEFVKENKIDLTIVGPELPLTAGIVDRFEDEGLLIFGPDKYASQLEGSKLFARDLMKKYNIPSPDYYGCESKKDVDYAKNKFKFPLVLKADGLAAGKGVIICKNKEEYENGLKIMFHENRFGDAGKKVSVEECLIGEEISVFAICDGHDFIILNSAQDYKRAFDFDKGPNTGGMGAFSPTPLLTKYILDKTKSSIIKPILKAMDDLGHPYRGFLYIGLMIVEGEPFVIEFNVRMGDPETQVVLPLLETSLFKILWNAVSGKLKNTKVKISPSAAVTVVLASEGYPDSYTKGMQINGLNNSDLLFHAGTIKKRNKIITNGGRVLNVVGIGENIGSAIKDAYCIADKIDFDGKIFRKDIGQKGISLD